MERQAPHVHGADLAVVDGDAQLLPHRQGGIHPRRLRDGDIRRAQIQQVAHAVGNALPPMDDRQDTGSDLEAGLLVYAQQLQPDLCRRRPARDIHLLQGRHAPCRLHRKVQQDLQAQQQPEPAAVAGI